MAYIRQKYEGKGGRGKPAALKAPRKPGGAELVEVSEAVQVRNKKALLFSVRNAMMLM